MSNTSLMSLTLLNFSVFLLCFQDKIQTIGLQDPQRHGFCTPPTTTTSSMHFTLYCALNQLQYKYQATSCYCKACFFCLEYCFLFYLSWLGRASGVGNGNPLQYSCLENSMDREAQCTAVHGVTKSQTWPSDCAWAWISTNLQKNVLLSKSSLCPSVSPFQVMSESPT